MCWTGAGAASAAGAGVAGSMRQRCAVHGATGAGAVELTASAGPVRPVQALDTEQELPSASSSVAQSLEFRPWPRQMVIVGASA